MKLPENWLCQKCSCVVLTLRLWLLHVLILPVPLIFAEDKNARVWVDGRNHPYSDTLHLEPQDRVLIMEFAEPTGTNHSYRYQMDGVDPQWIETRYPVVRYKDLPGGTFRFRMNFAKTRVPVADVVIVKTEVFWREWWFLPMIVIYAVILVGVGVYLFFLYDFRQKLKMQYVRNQIAADLHDEVGSNLNSIAIFIELLRKNAPAEMLPVLEKIVQNSRESVTLMQDTVWTINPRNDDLMKLFERMNSFASQLLAGSGIALSFTMPETLSGQAFTMDQRKNIYLMFKEAINNIVKHAGATFVRITISVERNEVKIYIEDNGRGFDLCEEHGGNGLNNFRDRAAESQIGLKIESQVGQGTAVCMRVAI